MTEQNGKLQNLAPLRNVVRMMTLVQRLQGRADGIPGLGCFYGRSGLGKTMSATYCVNQTQGVHVEVRSVWSHKDLCTAILTELGIVAKGTAARMVDTIAEHLAIEQVPLFIDEADYLVRKQSIEIVRDIYESCDVPVILIGEEELPGKLRKWERVHGRVRSWVTAQPADDDDFNLLKTIRCPNVELRDDLRTRIMEASNGSARRIVVNLDEAREIAARDNKKALGLQDWTEEFFTGVAPDARSLRRAS